MNVKAIEFWRNILSSISTDFEKEALLIAEKSKFHKINNWNDVFIAINNTEDLKNYNFPYLGEIYLDDNNLYSSIIDNDFIILKDEIFLEINFDLSMKTFEPKKGENKDFAHSSLFPRMSMWASKLYRSGALYAIIDLNFYAVDYDNRIILNEKFRINDGNKLKFLILPLIKYDFIFREKVVQFIRERDEIYFETLYPSKIVNHFRRIFKNEHDAHRDSFVKNSHRRECVIMEYAEISMIIEIYERLVQNIEMFE